MRKRTAIFAALFIISSLVLSLTFNACDKDTNCYVKVTVQDETTKLPLSKAFVKIDIDSSYVSAEGYTNVLGQFETMFTAPAIFNVVATYEDGYDSVYTQAEYYCYRKGSNTVRLKEGDTVYTTVSVSADINREYR